MDSIGKFEPNSRRDMEDSKTAPLSSKEKQRRYAHTMAEKKRRDAIREGYDNLADLVPACKQVDPLSTTSKLSKAVILSKTIEYMENISEKTAEDEQTLEKLQKEATGLKIMLQNYESILKSHRQANGYQSTNVADTVKIDLFKNLCDELFLTFDSEVLCDNFQNLSSGMLHWSERHCKPEHLHHIFEPGISSEERHPNPMRIVYQPEVVYHNHNYQPKGNSYDPRR